MAKIDSKMVSYILGIGIIIGIIIFIAVPSHSNNGSAKQSTSGNIIIQLTDPPQVPTGTQSLVITYNSLKLHVLGSSNTSGFINVNVSGSVDLLNITNTTQTIGVMKTNTKLKFDMVRFNITSAKITLNNTVYNVTVPNGELNVHFKKNLSARNGSSGVIIQLNPTVVQIYTSNQTIFILVPSAKAIIIGNKSINKTAFRVGTRVRLESHIKRELEDITPNITISSAQLMSQNNNTFLSVTVKNNANVSVTLNHLFIVGAMSATLPATFIKSQNQVIPAAISTAHVGFATIESAASSFNSINSSDISTATAGMNVIQAAEELGIMNKSIKIGNYGSIIINRSNIDIIEKELGISRNESIKNISNQVNRNSVSFIFNSLELLNVTINNSGMNLLQAAEKLGMMNRSIEIGNKSIIINRSNMGTIEKELKMTGNESMKNISKKFGQVISNRSTDVLNRTESELQKIKTRENEIRTKFSRGIMKDIHNFNSSNPEVKKLIHRTQEFRGRYFNMINFIITKNGTLSLPYVRSTSRVGMESEMVKYKGYTLSADNSITLKFNKKILLPDAYRTESISQQHIPSNIPRENFTARIGQIFISLITNQTYKIKITGENGAYAVMNMSAQ